MTAQERSPTEGAALDRLLKDPAIPPIATLIWLHGLGADGSDMEPVARELRLPGHLPVRHIFPHAPERAVTLNGGLVMRAWYDIMGAVEPVTISVEDFLESVDLLRDLIREEVGRGMPCERILLAGFSQGGALALFTGLCFEKPLAGILAISCAVVTLELLETERRAANRKIPIFMAHGTEDAVIPPERALRTRRTLTRLGYAVDWRTYRVNHSVCAEELADIRAWLITLLEGLKPAA